MSDPDDFEPVDEDARAWTVAIWLIITWTILIAGGIGYGIFKLTGWVMSLLG